MPTLMTKPCYWAEKNAKPCPPTCNECRGEQTRSFYYEACGVGDCDYNAYGGAPRHTPSDNCKSGSKSHCTCDTCF